VTDVVTYLATIPSPTEGAWNLFGIPLRMYAFCILLGIVAATLITERRLRQRGAPHWLTLDIGLWAVPFGIVGARIYHLITSPDDYFGANGHPLDAFKIWNGGLGIWGAVAGGALGAWIACRRLGIPLTFFADAIAVGLPVAQAIGRWGNYFNNELYGRHTNLPWGLVVHEYDLNAGKAVDLNGDGSTILPGGPFHPTFLYEFIWDLGVALLVYLVDRRYKLGKGRAFALYVMAYTVGRSWIEALRIDTAHHFLGLRINDWVSIFVFLGALAYFLIVKGPQQHVKLDDKGKLVLVTAEGEPIEWRKPGARTTTSTEDGGDEVDDETDGDGDGGSDADALGRSSVDSGARARGSDRAGSSGDGAETN
jgi:prolipoprotein diacylglyceryl transferase